MYRGFRRSDRSRNERKSKRVKQARSSGFREKRQRGDRVLLKRNNVDGVRCPRHVRPGAGIGSESRLPVGCRRHQTKAAIEPPSPPKEGTDRLAPSIPLRQRRHGIRGVLFQEGHKTVQIKLFPGLQITAKQLLLCWVRREFDRGLAMGVALRKRLTRPL